MHNFLKHGVPPGLKIFVNDFACITNERVQCRFPKSKKKRIRKKWSKRPSNYRIKEVHRMIQVGNNLYVSSNIYEQLKKEQ